jgi:hypothetical protein
MNADTRIFLCCVLLFLRNKIVAFMVEQRVLFCVSLESAPMQCLKIANVLQMVANKFVQDEGETSEVENWYWSDLSGFDCKQLNQLERHFLAAIVSFLLKYFGVSYGNVKFNLQKWEVFVKDKEFWSALLRLHRTVCLRQGLRRGWFTYEETAAILDILPLSQILHQTLQVNMKVMK